MFLVSGGFVVEMALCDSGGGVEGCADEGAEGVSGQTAGVYNAGGSVAM